MLEEGEIDDVANDCLSDAGSKTGNNMIDEVEIDMTNVHRDDCGNNVTKNTIFREGKVDKIDEPTREN